MRLFRRRDKHGKPHGHYIAQWLDPDGERHQRSTHSSDKIAAEGIGRQWERESADPALAAAAKTTLNDALSAMLGRGTELVAAGKCAASTRKIHQIRAGHWCRILGHHFLLKRLDAPAVDRFISARRGEGAVEHTIHKELAVLRTTLRLAIRAGTWAGQIERVMPVGFSPDYTPRTRAPTPDEVSRLLGELKADRAARVAFIVATSAEWGATDRAERVDVAKGRGEVLVRGTKNAKRWRRVPIVTTWQRSLLAYALWHAEGTGGLLFRPWSTGSNVRDLKAACARLGIEPVTANDLRRAFATWMREDGIPLELVSPAMGHVDTQMVQRVYGRLSAEALGERLESAVAACSANAAERTGTAGWGGWLEEAAENDNGGEVARDPRFERGAFGSGGQPRQPSRPPKPYDLRGLLGWSPPKDSPLAALMQRQPPEPLPPN